ncbi:MAG: AraC family transcriptional regulator [Sphingomonadaceae bacterium]|nr:AraC family transcriptional regulator [Sphingomonadaceae bacterium]
MMAGIVPSIGAQPATLGPAVNRKRPDTHLYGALFAGAALCFCLARLLGEQLGPASAMFAVAGSATCGWSWLLARALFRAPEARRGLWPLALVLALVAADAFDYFRADHAAPLARLVVNAETLLSSTLLLLALIEPLKDVHRGMARAECRFRAAFAGGYAMLMAIAVIGIDGAAPGSVAEMWSGTIKAACAALALAGTGLALRYRGAHPLPQKREGRRRPAIADANDLGNRLAAAIRDEAVYTRPELRVADVARRLGEAEYKVTQCITGPLGFRNFNHMINQVRIAAAKRQLADASFDRLPVLTIALDCGFGSIGPFNRAFKAETGMTPVHFRKTCRRAAAARKSAGDGHDAYRRYR